MTTTDSTETMTDTDIDAEITEGIARGPWVLHWADQEEENGASFSGCQLDDLAPSAPQWAHDWSERRAAAIVAANGCRLAELYRRAVAAGYPHNAEQFGYDLGMQAIGSGVHWTDFVPWRHGRQLEIRVPHCDFYEHCSY